MNMTNTSNYPSCTKRTKNDFLFNEHTSVPNSFFDFLITNSHLKALQRLKFTRKIYTA